MKSTPSHRHSRFAASLAITALTLTLAGCGSSDDSEDTSNDVASEAEGKTEYPLTLESPWGETELEEVPENIVPLNESDLDALLALGIEPLAKTTDDVGTEDDSSFRDEALEEMGMTREDLAELPVIRDGDGPKNETILGLEPDLITGTEVWSLDKEKYEILEDIAPVLTLEEDSDTADMSWQDRFRLVSEPLDRADQVEEQIDEYDEITAQIRENHPEFEGKTFAWISVLDEKAVAYPVPGSGFANTIEDIGFEVAEEPVTGVDPSNWDTALEFSHEKLPDINADVVIFSWGSEELQEKYEDSSLLQNVPAVENGMYVDFVDNEKLSYGLSFPSPLVAPHTANRLVELVEDVVE